jgi:nucleotide-binding universal stress UspA family protein
MRSRQPCRPPLERRRTGRAGAISIRVCEHPGTTVGPVYGATPHGKLADAMMARARQRDADLVVMGAYGHPRWAQRVLGGATQGMLGATTLPLLLSH